MQCPVCAGAVQSGYRTAAYSQQSVYHKQPLTDSSVIMDVMNVEQAKIAEEAGAVAVMALGEPGTPCGGSS